MADGEISSDEWSDDEFIDQIGDFELHHLDENDRQRLNSVLQNFENNADNDTGDVDFFGNYETPDVFEWNSSYSVCCIKKFEEVPGPVRIYDTSASPLELFQVFYSNEILQHITECTNLNAQRKRALIRKSTKLHGQM
ncbi:hypothetical protein DPMN_132048 [Dreissena polymorpha]|uniref:PiggyBac transposable element-derived protein domain-containing protein n=1 Tax=Dreissena polymorpha TaxID=45954 RepID=A0A9D4J9Q9_DREPO|nr:hypothetical protein DPMN_132048 [Dreissena polymorpha]